MTPQDAYILRIISLHANPTSQFQAQGIINLLYPHITTWSEGYLDDFRISGSIAKGTGISGSSDIDLLVSLRHDTPTTLQNMYDTLHQRMVMANLIPRKQNVSIGMNIYGLKIDLVPAKKQTAISNDHSLWSHKKQSNRQTNIHEHIRLVSQSGRINEIKALKIWRKLHNLELPSLIAEMIVINALRGRSLNNPASNFLSVMRYVQANIMTLRIVDPSNSNNIITDDLTIADRQALRSQATTTLSQPYWESVLW